MSAFRLTALDPHPYAALFDLSDERLAAVGAQRHVATDSLGYPCRISLEDATEGDELLLLPFEHQPASSPYRASGPIFVRRGVRRRTPDTGEIPRSIARRLLSVRGYDGDDEMIEAEVCDGAVVAAEIERQFANRAVMYLHLHFARRGCFACRVDRVR